MGYIIDIRNCPGGDDSTAIAIINRFCDTTRVAFHRKTKIGPGDDDFTPVKTWHLEAARGHAVYRTDSAVDLRLRFSGGEVSHWLIRELPYVTMIGDHTNGIFSYELEKKLP